MSILKESINECQSDICSKLKFESLELKIVGRKYVTLNCYSVTHIYILFLNEWDQTTCFEENIFNSQNRGSSYLQIIFIQDAFNKYVRWS